MKFSRVISYVLIIVIPLILVFGNFRILAYNLNFYQILYQKSGVYNKFTPKEVKDHTINLFGYYRGKNQLDTNFYSKQAILHLKDVKTLFFETNGLLYLSLIIFCLFGAYLYLKSPKLFLNSIFVGSLSTIILMIILALGLFIDFRPFFEVFHRLTFSNDLWLFPSEDTLIQLFPPQFFQLFSNILALDILLSSAFIAFSSFIIKNKKNASNRNFHSKP